MIRQSRPATPAGGVQTEYSGGSQACRTHRLPRRPTAALRLPRRQVAECTPVVDASHDVGGGGAMAVPGNLASPGMRIVGGLIDVVILIVVNGIISAILQKRHRAGRRSSTS